MSLKAQGKPQVIAPDHAGRDVWGDIPGVVGLREWRDGGKLVPMKWLEADSDGATSQDQAALPRT